MIAWIAGIPERNEMWSWWNNCATARSLAERLEASERVVGRDVRGLVAVARAEVRAEASARQTVGLEVDGQDVEAVGEQALGDRPADPARGARDQRGPGAHRRSASFASRASHLAPTSSIQRIASPSGAGVSE